MPILEAIPDERQMMKSKLVTLPKTTMRLPIISSGISGNPTLEAGQQQSIIPQTPNYQGGNQTFGYTCIVSDGDVLSLMVGPSGQLSNTNLPTTPVYLGDGTGTSVSVMGKNFIITARNQFVQDRQATVTIIGNETGGRTSFTVTVRKVSVPVIDTTSNTFLQNSPNR